MLSRFLTAVRRLGRDRAGHIAVTLALAAIPLTLATGAGIDYARGLVVRSNMADALDAAGLAVGKQASKPSSCSTAAGSTTTQQTTCAGMQAIAQQFFNANFKRDSSSTGATPTVVITIANSGVTLSASDAVPTTFLHAADVMLNSTALESMAISASSTVVWGQTKLWVALVLDNTGSMCEPDSSPCPTDTNTNIKINALKSASHSLLTTLQNASTTPGDVMAAIVPFAKDVNVGTGNVNASWIDWTDWNTAYPGTAPGILVGPGDNCPFPNSIDNCLTQPGGVLQSNGISMTTTNNIPSSGTYAGYICPGSITSSSSGQTGHYYNGCYTSVANGSTTQVDSGKNSNCNGYNNCTCTGSSSSSSRHCDANQYTHVWATNPKSTWRGCVMDRNQDDDTTNTTPGTLFPAENDDSCVVAPVTLMTNPVPTTTAAMNTMYTNLNTQIDNMKANGGTNQTIGLAHGMQILVSGAPYNAPALPGNTTRYIILLSDGLNTMDRWYGNGSSQSTSVDTRMSTACANAKAQSYIIYTIFVDLGSSGNSTVLSNCATDSSKYYHLTTSGAIITTFAAIAQQITNLRVSQ